jgi:hypothetical protein
MMSAFSNWLKSERKEPFHFAPGTMEAMEVAKAMRAERVAIIECGHKAQAIKVVHRELTP